MMNVKRRPVLCWMLVVNMTTVVSIMSFIMYTYFFASTSHVCPEISTQLLCMFTSFKPDLVKFHVSLIDICATVIV